MRWGWEHGGEGWGWEHGSEGRAGSMVVRGWGWEHGSEGAGLGAW